MEKEEKEREVKEMREKEKEVKEKGEKEKEEKEKIGKDRYKIILCTEKYENFKGLHQMLSLQCISQFYYQHFYSAYKYLSKPKLTDFR